MPKKPLEDDLVQRIARAGVFHSRLQLRLGIGDDSALLAARPGYETILTCDWFLEGSHFLRDKHPADSVGWKCLARAVSDIAAMGGYATCFLLSLALPESLTGHWLDDFLGGLRRAARRFECPLVGGDTTQRRQVLASVTVVGEVRAGRALRRAGAKAGDLIFVSGRLGEAALGLQTLRRGARGLRTGDSALRKHLYPEPRLALGQWLANGRIATSMMDLSDGLSSDLPRLCAASGVGARIAAAQIPQAKILARDFKKGTNALQLALNGGDDYELLFTVNRSQAPRVPRSFRGLALTQIGEITRQRKIVLMQEDGLERRLLPQGWDPFRRGK
jgi:thiamine-monophosphate kinase